MPEKNHLHWYAIFSNVSFGAAVMFFPTLMNWGKVDLVDLIFQSIEVFGFGAFLIVQGILHWWSFVYWVEGEDLRIEQGVLRKKEIIIPLTSVRAVELNDTVVKRALGIVRMQIKTAATGTQADIAAISRQDARALRAIIQQHAQLEEEDAEAADIMKASFRTLVLAGATSGGLFWGLGALWIVDSVIGVFFDTPTIDLYISNLAENWSDALIIFFAGYLPLSGLAATLLAAIKFGNFEVQRNETELRIRHGLFTRQSVTIPLDRVQAVHFVQSPVRQLLRVGAVKVEAVGHAEEKGQSSELFPVIREKDFEAFLARFVPELAGPVPMERPPSRALPRFLFLPSMIVLIPATVVTLLIPPWGALLYAAWLPVLLFKWLDFKQSGGGISGDLGAFENRSFVTREIYKVPRKAVRSVKLSQSIFARRRDLATVSFVVATGAFGRTVVAENLDQQVADQMLDWRPGGEFLGV